MRNLMSIVPSGMLHCAKRQAETEQIECVHVVEYRSYQAGYFKNNMKKTVNV